MLKMHDYYFFFIGLGDVELAVGNYKDCEGKLCGSK